MDLNGRVALVFGGSSGIGAAVCKLLLQAGAKVCCADIQPEVEILEKEDVRHAYEFTKADVTSKDSINAALQKVQDKLGAPDFVINCSGIINEFDYERCIDVNFTGTVRTLLATLSHIGRDKGGKGGSYLAISSFNSLRISPEVPVYAGTKAAINQLVRCYAADLHFSHHGVRINTILPGGVDTPLVHSLSSAICFTASGIEGSHDKKRLSPEAVAEEIVGIVNNQDMNGQCMLFSRTGGLEKVAFDKEEEYQSKVN